MILGSFLPLETNKQTNKQIKTNGPYLGGPSVRKTRFLFFFLFSFFLFLSPNSNELVSFQSVWDRLNSLKECTLDDSCQVNRFTLSCHKPLFKMISKSTKDIKIRNRYMSQGLNQYPVVTNVHSVGQLLKKVFILLKDLPFDSYMCNKYFCEVLYCCHLGYINFKKHVNNHLAKNL